MLKAGFGLGPQAGWIREEITATVERGEAPDGLGLWVLGEAGDEVLCGLAHDLRERPVLLLGDVFEPLVERIGELYLSSCHDAFYTSFSNSRQCDSRLPRLPLSVQPGLHSKTLEFEGFKTGGLLRCRQTWFVWLCSSVGAVCW